MMDLDCALRTDPPAALTNTSTVEQKHVYEQWDRSNRMSLMVMKNSISVAIRGAILDSDNTKTYLSHVEDQFKGTSKAHASTLILKMLTTKYDGISGVRENIMTMSDMANKLKGMDMSISNGFLVHFIMTSLPVEYGPFNINYNTHKEKWTMSELIAMCVQEEERLRIEKPDVAHLTTSNSKKRKSDSSKAPKTGADSCSDTSSSSPYCKFCRKKGHYRSECPKFKEWLTKKGNIVVNVIHESLSMTVPLILSELITVKCFMYPTYYRDFI
ncbi:hypothetical protein L2E82_51665 [Cichorium intybus]|nr:hypothetical protein L2E82_51665 [Cichorium intybus]